MWEGSGCDLIWGKIPKFSWRDCKSWKSWARVVGAPPGTRTWHLPNTNQKLSLEPTKSTGTAASACANHSVTNFGVISRITQRNFLQNLPTLFNLRKVQQPLNSHGDEPEKYRGWKDQGLTGDSIILLYWVLNADMGVEGDGGQPPTQTSTGFIVHSQSRASNLTTRKNPLRIRSPYHLSVLSIYSQSYTKLSWALTQCRHLLLYCWQQDIPPKRDISPLSWSQNRVLSFLT
jgi:hypothetical protein